MVEIIEKTERKISLENKVKKLTKLTRKFFINNNKFFNYISSSDDLIFIQNYNPLKSFMSYSANCSCNSIRIKNSKDFAFALKLAEEYEKQTGEKWTLEKDYSQ